MLESVPFFDQLYSAQKERFIDNLIDETFNENDVVYSAGDQASFLVVMDGELTVLNDDSSENTILQPGHVIGSDEIVSCSTMPHKVVASTTTRIRRASASSIEECFETSLSDLINNNDIKRILTQIFLFKSLSEEQVDRVVRAFTTQKYKPNDWIVQKGELAKHFFLIRDGSVKIIADENRYNIF